MVYAVTVSNGGEIVAALVAAVVRQRTYLSEIDGAIGDGDHGVNMAKGFMLCADAMAGQRLSLPQALRCLSESLMEGIGGSMGPLYGSLFMGMAQGAPESATLCREDVLSMLQGGLRELQAVSSAQVGDKTMMDAYVPAVSAFEVALRQGDSLERSLCMMTQAAARGRDSTYDLIARVGRASRLGERSRGALDAGAVSCSLLLSALADALLACSNGGE
ncbi:MULTISPECIES: dihydroxyacetone kinase subunit DhaL [Edwardsiella]|uniref:Dihydroxyacetone kinase subunit L n=2 Tax=Edwardsiella anguillarum TaxID=1821960 RepID=A0ABY8SK66_9GAMM|nr:MULTISPECIES: dihydroxyacetone kinase subunit DhaL [Edwardsiella]AKM48364.1 dihydroxyacetone kinase [Edwardsiella sp. EA181011]GAJ66408.1 dihydroxyacetone kinase subunit DhaL [Edwardsiella piscicida]AIJ09497.1 Putative dihydroxyacetone kinase, ADP-binding subunit [Edwardsiella anguillarum ET080813]AKR77285.1 dihydroxyacetone kinase subunit L [Edwardsiella sp. LADL05-105]KAB0590520.1 dihydroxyacetone kinase subunit L [Edwardsiella anguillarum]